MYERSRKVSRKGSENLDKHLLEALYHRYYKELYIFVYSLCGSETVTDDILEEILHKEEKKRVWDAVNRLKGQKKEVILLQYFGDFLQKEIAAMLKITPGNVKVLSYRAKKELKEYLTKEEGR